MTRKLWTLFAFCLLVASMVGANMTGHGILSFFLLLAAFVLVIWHFASGERTYRTMTIAEREAQAERCGGWGQDGDPAFRYRDEI